MIATGISTGPLKAMEKYDQLQVELEGEAKQALDSLNCIVSKFPTVPAKKDCMSCIDSVYGVFDKVVKTTRKCAAVYRIAIWNWELINNGKATEKDDVSRSVCRTILYHKFDIVVFQKLTKRDIELLLQLGLPSSRRIFDKKKVVCMWNTTRIKDIELKFTTGFTGKFDLTIEAHHRNSTEVACLDCEIWKKFHISDRIQTIKIVIDKSLPTLCQWTTGHEATIISDLKINTKENFKYPPIYFIEVKMYSIMITELTCIITNVLLNTCVSTLPMILKVSIFLIAIMAFIVNLQTHAWPVCFSLLSCKINESH